MNGECVPVASLRRGPKSAQGLGQACDQERPSFRTYECGSSQRLRLIMRRIWTRKRL